MNRLQHETSPYLLQHAHNPVDWYAWRPEAFEKAREANKPILLSIGYATCHWCHVMERESFEDPRVAAFMNEHFINIKVDREERPDVDQIYMEACQLMTGAGGWPLNCFLLPDLRPFFAGTYYPPQPGFGKPSWPQLLQHIAYLFREKPDVVQEQAAQLTGMMQGGDHPSLISGPENTAAGNPETVLDHLRRRYDRNNGGFGGAPKFPGTMALTWLLHYTYYNKEQDALRHLELSLDKMIMGGIYDQIGGGFARYATDIAWLVPHFEKMLYDNALLLSLLSKTYQYTGKTLYREAIEHTIAFIDRELSHPDGGFFSALDADSEGEEGKFYVWDYEELAEVAGEDLYLAARYFGAKPAGNWEGNNILWRPVPDDVFEQNHRDIPSDWKARIEKVKTALLAFRSHRIRPALDDKILLDWNALMISAYFDAAEATGNDEFGKRALRALDFLLRHMLQPDGRTLWHTWKDGKAQYDGYLNNYAYLIDALLHAHAYTQDTVWLDKADHFAKSVFDLFGEEADPLFYFSVAGKEDILMRKKDWYDSAVPSGNAVMAGNLLQLGVILENQVYLDHAQAMLRQMSAAIEAHPISFGWWATVLLDWQQGLHEIAVLGPDALELSRQIRQAFIPGRILQAANKENDAFPLLRYREPPDGKTWIYLCRQYACQKPVDSWPALQQQLQGSPSTDS